MTMATAVISNGEEQEQLLQNGQMSRHRRSHTLETPPESNAEYKPEYKPECSPSYKVSHENGVVRLLNIAEVPPHLAFNQNIRSGYRNALTLKQCISSVFWLTNETVNIWSHLFGCFLFMAMLFYDLCLLNFHASVTDKFIVGGLLLCFQGCMITSVLYHTFNCRSEKHFHCLLKYDLYGISFSLLAIYMSGIYYAFWCNVEWCIFYSVTVAAIFFAVITIQVVSSSETLRIGTFVFWAVYGVIPTIHWMFAMGGWDNPIVQKLLPRVINMYAISGSAFFIYMTYIPERFFPVLGKIQNKYVTTCYSFVVAGDPRSSLKSLFLFTIFILIDCFTS